MKKVTLLFFVFLMLFVNVSFAKEFVDVPQDFWAYEYIDELSEKGIIDGYDDGLFKPNGTVTNVEFLKLVVAASIDPNVKVEDAKGKVDNWAKDYIKIAENYGVVRTGKIDEKNADEEILRIDMAMIIANSEIKFFGKTKSSNLESSFTDTQYLEEKDIEAINYCIQNGLIVGYEDGSFKPYNKMTRAEAATIISRFLINNKNVNKVTSVTKEETVDDEKNSSSNNTSSNSSTGNKGKDSLKPYSNSGSQNKKYTITFVNDDGTVLQTSSVEKNAMPVYSGDTPTKESTDTYEYVFVGWEPEIVSVTENATYTATYTEQEVGRRINIVEHEHITITSAEFTDEDEVLITYVLDDGYSIDSVNITDTEDCGFDYDYVDDNSILSYGPILTDVTIDITVLETEYGLNIYANPGRYEGATQKWYYATPNSTMEISDPTRTSYTVTFDDSYGECDTESLTSCVFVRWDLTGGGSFDGTTYTFGKENGKLTAIYEDTITLPGAELEDHNFIGWYNSSNKLVGGSGDSYTVKKNETLTAKYEYIREMLPSIPNPPVLGQGMTLVYWDDNNVEYEADLDDISEGNGNVVYDYVMSDGRKDSMQARWANAKTTSDDSYWVWIPRYAYKVNYYDDMNQTIHINNKKIYLNIDIIFLYVTSNTQYKDISGDIQDLPEGYIVHPAFQKMTSTDVNNLNSLGKWNEELEGIWVSKFDISKEAYDSEQDLWNASDANSELLTVGEKRIVSKPSVKSAGFVPNYAYQNALNMHPDLNSHLLKNSEFGMLTMFEFSPYGRTGNSPSRSNCQDCYTGGYSGGMDFSYDASTFYDNYAWNTKNGKKSSSTGNVYGVYDLNGCRTEWVSSYLNNGSSNITNPASVGEIGNISSNPTELELRTRQIYPEKDADPCVNYEMNSDIYGDAMYEISVGNPSRNSPQVAISGNGSYFFGDNVLIRRSTTYTTSSISNMFQFTALANGDRSAGMHVALAITED